MYSPGTALTRKGEFVYNPCLKFHITVFITPGNRVQPVMTKDCPDSG